MKYLKSDDVSEHLQDINHEAYKKQCNNLGCLYNSDYVTKYVYELITHPANNKNALVINDESLLNVLYIAKLISAEQMTNEGWFETNEV